MKILFIDDEKEILSSIKRQFRKIKYEITTCASGKQALELLSNEEYPIVISDERMPDINGLELMKMIKEQHPDTIRIILSGYADSQTIIEAINQGEIFRFISKPWELEELLKNIAEAEAKWEANQHNKLFMKQIIEENKRLKMRLTYRESQLDLSQEVLDEVPTPVIIVGKEDNIEVFNNRVKSELGIDLILGDKITTIIPEDIYTTFNDNLQKNDGTSKAITEINGLTLSLYIRALRPTDNYKGIIIIEREEDIA